MAHRALPWPIAMLLLAALTWAGCPDPGPVADDDDDDDVTADDDDDDATADDDDATADDDDSTGDDDDATADDDDSTGDDDDDTAANSMPQAAAAATPNTGIAPLLVDFQGVVAGGDPPLLFYWNFADGSTSSLQDPSHTFASAGTYDVMFEVSDADGDMDSAQVTISVGSDNNTWSYPALSITANPASGDIPLAVGFTASTVGGDMPLSYAWDFGDGATSTQQNPSHSYTTVGTYQAICDVTDATGDVDSKSVTIVAFDPNAPPTAPQLTGTLLDVEWVNVPTNAAEIYEPNNRSLWAYDFDLWEGPATSYSATGWLDPEGELIYTVEVVNEGLGNPNLFWVDLYTDPGYVPAPPDPGVGDYFDYIWGLHAGETETLTFVWDTVPQIDAWYESYVVIDSDEQWVEMDESDNVIGPIDAHADEDWDWYEVYLLSGDVLEIWVEVPPNVNLDYDLDLYGPDTIFDAVSYEGPGDDEYIYFVADDEGPYWIRVYTLDGLSGDPNDYYVIDVEIS